MNTPLAVILAGGEGRRIGGAKPLRLLAGERLIDRAVRRARHWSDDVRLSLRQADQIADSPLPVLLDDSEVPGPLGGLTSALAAAREAGRELLLTIPCDVPFLPADLGPRLQAAIGTRAAALAASGADPHPTCALWRVEVLEHLPGYLASGRRSLIGLAEAVGYARAEWDAACFFNVNSEADLAEAERRLVSEVENVDRRSRLDPGTPRP